jgi:hypothetical protein
MLTYVVTNKRSHWRLHEGVVVQVLDKAFDIYMPYLGVEKRIYMDKLQEAGLLEAFEYQKENGALTILWAGGVRAVMPDEGKSVFRYDYGPCFSQALLRRKSFLRV